MRSQARAGSRARLSDQPLVFMYHSVDVTDTDPFAVTVSPQTFERQLCHLRRRGLKGCNMRDLFVAKAQGRARGLVGLTFDDGYVDFLRTAVPILRRHDFTATVFVLSDRLGGTNAWESHGPVKPLMTLAELREAAAAGMEVASHGATHVSLPEAGDRALHEEVHGSRGHLQDVLKTEVVGFAYPYGHVGAREVDAVREAGYGYGCAIWPSAHTGAHALQRTYVGERDGALRLLAKEVRHGLRTRRAS